MAVYALLAVYAERKVSAFIQDRLGPMEAGPYGAFQTLADVLKLVLKEPIIPQAADRWLFAMAPGIIFVSVFAGLAVLPLAPGMAGSEANVGLLYLMGVVAIDVIGLLMAGWGANNKYALLGASRSVAQIVSYEVPSALVLLSAVMMHGTLSLQGLSLAQGIYSPEPVYFLGIWEITAVGGLLSWSVFRYPHLLLGLVVYLIAGLAESNRAPFDIPEAESELVSGYHVEYSGFRFALVMLSEYGKMLIVGLIATVVFLGGWNTPLPNVEVGDWALSLAQWTSGPAGSLGGVLWGSFWVLSKAFLIVLIFMWVRWTYPRVRVDQLMHLCWKVLTPAGFLLILISGAWKLAEVYATL
jgi:NADH-quinone oxidoreductase subunit H